MYSKIAWIKEIVIDRKYCDMSKLQWSRVIGVIDVTLVDIVQWETYLCWPCECITLSNHVIRFQDFGLCELYYVGPHIEYKYLFIIHTYIGLKWNLGWSLLPVLPVFIRIIVHPGNIKRKHCSTQ